MSSFFSLNTLGVLQLAEQQPQPVAQVAGRGVQAEHQLPRQGARQGLQEGPPLHQEKAGLSPQAGEKGEQGDSRRRAQEGTGQHPRYFRQKVEIYKWDF